MATVDLTTFTEVDAGGDISRTADRCTVDTMIRAVDSYVYKDYGAGHFGNFSQLLTLNISAFDAAGYVGIWSLSNAYGSVNAIDYLAGMALTVYGSGEKIELYDLATMTHDDYTAGPGTFYLTIERNGTTATCKIYSDAARTAGNLLAALTKTVSSDAFRYLQVCFSRNASGTDTGTLYVEDLDLQETAAPATYRGVLLATRGRTAPTAFGQTIAGMWAQVAYGNWKKLTGAITPTGSLVVAKLGVVKIALAGIAASAGAVLKMTSKSLTGRWERPTGYTATTKWTSVASSYDDNTDTYAENTAANWNNYVELTLDEALTCNKVRIFAEDVS